MKNSYDFLILNNCPSFYKINLYNELAQKSKIFVVFFGISDQVIIDENFKDNIEFDYFLLNDFQVEKRSFIKTFFQLSKLLNGKVFKKVIYGGYIEKEFLVLSLLISKDKNVLQTESAAESKRNGIIGFIKSLIIKRYSQAIVSGATHAKVLRELGFRDEILISGGVGIFKKNNSRSEKRNVNNLKFLYVGRLIEKKNVGLLIEVFNELNLPLTIVGDGELKDILEEKANNNIKFIGFCPNDEIHKVYQDHNVFVLPSIIEPWGLVVEEALYNNCVVILSNTVGSLNEMLMQPKSGVAFDPYSKESLKKSISEAIDKYLYYYENVKKIDFNIADEKQVNQYLNLLHE